MEIRPGRHTDATAIAVVHVDGWRWGYRGLLPDAVLAQQSVADRTERWSAMLRDESTSVLVAEDAEGVCGFVSFGPTRDADHSPATVHEVYALYVAHRVARSGVGSALMTGALAEAPPTCDRASVWMLRDNDRAGAFYRRHGFSPDGAVKPFELGGLSYDDVRLVRPLAAPAEGTP